ncbi:MAG: SusC/RagA family protein, partial [Muribaculaceae bacterium]|nr:SusC/RagA family protein [Muribaculaceae bacterium]
MYKDVNGDGIISEGAYTLSDHGDLKLIGNSTPRWLFSLDLNADYKGFDLRVYFQGVAKRDYWQGSNYFWGITDNFWWAQGLKQHSNYFRDENTWSVQQGYNNVNTNSYYPKPEFDGNTWKNKQTQTRYLQDASYIRLKNLQVGYSLPKSIVSKIGFDVIRVYFSGENLWTGTHLSSLFDPETIDDPHGWGGCCYPLSRTISFGLNLTL